MSDALTTPEQEIDPELRDAAALLSATIKAAKKARRNARTTDLTSVDIDVPAPYAKEKRLIADTIAKQGNVLAVGTPNLAGEYQRGATVTLFGFAPDIKHVQTTFEKTLADAFAALAAHKPRIGEDVATFRSSFLLGYRLGLRVDELDQAAVEEAVIRVDQPGKGVTMRSTGSGAWAGYLAAQGKEASQAQAEITAEATAA